MNDTHTFILQVHKFVEKAKLAPETVMKKVLMDISTAVVMRSPVDTGRFRANWQYHFGENSGSVTDSTDLSGGDTISTMHAAIMAGGIYGEHHISNNLPYAQVIEYGLYPNPPMRGSWVKGQGWVIKSEGGFSKQAPTGVVRLAVLEYQSFLDSAIAALP
jgi:hypothetical protein